MADETTTTTQENTETTAVQTETEQPKEGKQTSQNQQTTNLEDLIQRAVDRATNKLGNENKKLRGEIETLKKANLSDAEVRQLEIQEKEKEIAEREKALADKENRLFAIKAIKEAGLDDGSDASLSLVDFVMADDEDTIKERVKAFDTLVKRFVASEVDKTIKANGRTPAKGTSGTSETKTDSVAVKLGQETAKANQTAQSTLDYYLGGSKK